MDRVRVSQVADGVHLAEGDAVNWVLLTDGPDVTLIDAGYPGCRDQVLDSLAQIGRGLGDVAAVLVTHAHVDHVGSLPALLREREVPVLASPVEASHARRERLEQATPTQIVRHSWRPRVLRWSLHLVRLGALSDVAVPTAAAWPDHQGALDLPGSPVPIDTAGHTSGHTAVHLPQHGVVVTGDALVTGHPWSTRLGPQLLDPVFHHDLAAAQATLRDHRSLAADTIVPGHGPVWRGAWASAVDRALEVPSR